MTRWREDPELALPEPPDSVPAIPGPDPGLAIAIPAGPHRLLVDGERVTAVGSHRGPLERVLIDGVTIAEDVDGDAGAVANAVSSPGLARRERIGRGSTLETILAAPTLPLLVVQWSSATGRAPASVTAGLTGPGGARYRIGARSVVLDFDDGRRTALAVSPAPERISVEAGASPTALRLVITPAPEGPATLLLAAGSPGQVAGALAGAAHLGAHALRAREGRSDDGLELLTGVSEIDDGFRWVRWRLAAALARAAGADGDGRRSALWAGLAAVDVGDRPAAVRAHRMLQEAAPVWAAFVAAGLSTTFAEVGPALESADALLDARAGRSARAAARAGETGPEPPGARATALESLALALHDAAPPDRIAALEAAARESRLVTAAGRGEGRVVAGGGSARDAPSTAHAAPGAPGAPGGARRLPMAGPRQAAPTLAAWLSSLLAGEPGSPPPSGSSPSEEALCALASLFRAEPDAAWREWRLAVASGLAAGPSGPGTWDAVGGADGLVAPLTSSLLVGVARGLLGLAADAHTGRLRLAPRLPSHLTRLHVRGITLGSARLGLTCEREGSVTRFVLEPESASVPPMVVFEPAVAGRVRSVRVDGAPAELETRTAAGRTVIPVQIPVDATRTVEVVSA